MNYTLNDFRLNTFLLQWKNTHWGPTGCTFESTAPFNISFRNDDKPTRFKCYSIDQQDHWRDMQSWIAEMDGAILDEELDDLPDAMALCESQLVRYLAPAIHRHDAIAHSWAIDMMEHLGRTGYTK